MKGVVIGFFKIINYLIRIKGAPILKFATNMSECRENVKVVEIESKDGVEYQQKENNEKSCQLKIITLL